MLTDKEHKIVCEKLDKILDEACEALQLAQEPNPEAICESLDELLAEFRFIFPAASPAQAAKPEKKPEEDPSEEFSHTPHGYERAVKRAIFWTKNARERSNKIGKMPETSHSVKRFRSAGSAKTADHDAAANMHHKAIQYHKAAAGIANTLNLPEKVDMHRNFIIHHSDLMHYHKSKAESLDASGEEISEKTEFSRLKKATRRGLELRAAEKSGLKKAGMKHPWTKGAKVGQEMDFVRGKLYKGAPKVVYPRKKQLPLP